VLSGSNFLKVLYYTCVSGAKIPSSPALPDRLQEVSISTEVKIVMLHGLTKPI